MKLKLLISFFTLFSNLISQSYQLPDATSTFVMNGVATSNVLLKGDTVFIATNKGIQFTNSNYTNWTDIEVDLKNSSIIKMILDSRGYLWFTLGRDTTIAGNDLVKGSGIYKLNTITFEYSYFEQPKDPKINFNQNLITVPVTTNINNISYDIMETVDSLTSQRFIWLASFAGSLRYLNPDSVELGWRLKTPNLEKLDVAQNNSTGYAQRVFSLASDGYSLWVGTANGVYLTQDFGQSFSLSKYSHNQAGSLSGNFITELSYSDGLLFSNSRIVGSGESNALNIAVVNLNVDFESWAWEQHFEDDWVRRVTSFGDLILVGTNIGFFISDNGGQSWDAFSEFYGKNIDSEIDASRINDLFIHPGNSDQWYIATSSGFVFTDDNGLTYSIFKSKNTLPEISKNKNSLVYPSPFSPKHTNAFLNISFEMKLSGNAEVVIYNYAMEEVHKINALKEKSTAANMTWDGRNKNGEIMPNGVYFVMIKANTDIYWNKVVIVN